MKTFTIFGNGRIAETETQYQKALQLGTLIGKAGFNVCTGGYGGIMEAASRGCKTSGGKTIGITLKDSGGWANPSVMEERAMPTWRERLFALIETGKDGYVLFDGATGTMAEIFVLWEMTNKKILHKPIVIMGDYLKSLVTQLRKQPAFLFPEQLKTADTAEEAFAILKSS
jgi:uncharacterized protein (TIGR00725 family)